MILEQKKVRRGAAALAAGFALLMFAAPPARALGDDPPEAPKCKRGEVLDKKTGKCVKQKSERLSDEDRADYAYALAKAARYQEALEVLDTMKQPETAKALNYRGYATRKLGGLDEAIGYYLRSVELDSRYPLVREYLGEAYVEQGRPDLAREQLAMIETLCGRECEAYRALSEELAGHGSDW